LFQLESCTKKHKLVIQENQRVFPSGFVLQKLKTPNFFCCLFSSGWLSHPSEKNARQIGSSPQGSG